MRLSSEYSFFILIHAYSEYDLIQVKIIRNAVYMAGSYLSAWYQNISNPAWSKTSHVVSFVTLLYVCVV